jgi:hypothetical protein
MEKFLVYLGGVVGGYTLVAAPVGGTFLSGLDPLLNVVGSLSMIVFAGAFLVRGVRSILSN